MSSFKVTTVTSTDCTSAGDALRFIDQRNCIRGDFVLVSGDVVANFKLEDALALHRERRKKDKQAIMTIMTKKLSGASLKRFGYSDLVVGIDPDSKQLMTYQEERAHTQKGTHVRVESKFFKGRKSVQVVTLSETGSVLPPYERLPPYHPTTGPQQPKRAVTTMIRMETT
jgi:translation initiation factor eIF-2B subunit epsilon